MEKKLLGLMFAFFLVCNTGYAITFNVNTTDDTVDATLDGVCADANGNCSLRAAIQEANDSVAPATINVPAGTYLFDLDGTGEDLAATGDLDILFPARIHGAGPDMTTINALGKDRIFEVHSSSTEHGSLHISDLTLTNGSVSGNGGAIYGDNSDVELQVENVDFISNFASSDGGAIYKSGKLSIVDCVFTTNSSDSSGGAIYRDDTAPFDMSNTTFTNNIANGDGGGFYSNDGVHTFDMLTFTGNRAFSSEGGAGYFSYSYAPIDITNSSFANNSSTSGGGTLALSGSYGIFSLENVSFDTSSSGSSGGGCIYASTSTVDILLTNVTADGCTAGSDGGFLYNSTSGQIVCTDSTFTNNSADGDGGAFYHSSSLGVTSQNCTYTDNSSTGDGGAVYASHSADDLIMDSSFSGNIAIGDGGAWYSSISGTFMTVSSQFLSNTALSSNSGGAVYASPSYGLFVDSSTFASNSSLGTGGDGGALYVSDDAEITNSTFSGNIAGDQGGAIYQSDDVFALNNTFTGNSASMGAVSYAGSTSYQFWSTGNILANSLSGDNCEGTDVSMSFISGGANIDDDGTCLFAETTDKNNVDPLLGPLADNGGPCQTHDLLTGSPAIDAAVNGACPTTDGRGFDRPIDGDGNGSANCDIGAVETGDQCPNDPDKLVPGTCGCGTPDTDADGNGIADCLFNQELIQRLEDVQSAKNKVRPFKRASKSAALRAARNALRDYIDANAANITLSGARTLEQRRNGLLKKIKRLINAKTKIRKRKRAVKNAVNGFIGALS